MTAEMKRQVIALEARLVNRYSLQGRAAIVTGAGRGIGRAVALSLADAGASVVLAARSAAELDDTAEQVRGSGRPAIAVPTDIARADDVRRMVDVCVNEFGRLDVLVNNAGVSPVYTRAVKLAEADWRHVIDVNLTGTFLCCQAAADALFDSPAGRVINMVSVGAQAALPRLAAYCASKAGIESLTRVLAVEWAPSGVTVNAVGPGYVSTDFTAGLRDNAPLYEDIMRRTPQGRLGEPEDIVGAVLYLASDAAGYVTGHTIYVDGGWLA